MIDDSIVARISEAARQATHDGDLASLGKMLADDVQWHGNAPAGACHSRDDVLSTLQSVLNAGPHPQLTVVRAVGERILLGLEGAGEDGDESAWFVVTVDDSGRIVRLQNYSNEATAQHDLAIRDAATAAPPAPVGALVPFAHVRDVARSIAFYRLLGFEPTDTYTPEDRAVWASLKSESARLMVAEADAPINPHEQAVLFYLYARDLDALRDHLVAAGETPGEIVDGSPGPRREMRVSDPDGYCLMVAQIDDETVVGA